MSADKDLISVQQARDLVEAAHRAQAELAQFDQGKIDRICEAMAGAALRESARLGAMAVEETGYGVPDDKREKNRFAAEDVWNYFRSLRTKGVVSESKDVVEIASPRGVVAGIIPSTNPTSTAIFKILIAMRHLKMAVEVGFVEGMIPATTPRGLAISTTSFDSETTPTVRRFLK